MICGFLHLWAVEVEPGFYFDLHFMPCSAIKQLP